MHALGQLSPNAALMSNCTYYAALAALAWAFLLEPWLTRTVAQNLALTPYYDAPPPVADEDTLPLELSVWLTTVCYLMALAVVLLNSRAPLRRSALALTLALSLALNGLAPQPAPAAILHFTELLLTPVVPVAHTAFAPRLAWLHAVLPPVLSEAHGLYRVSAWLLGAWFYATLLALRRLTPSALVLSALWAYWLRPRAFHHGRVEMDTSTVRPAAAAAELVELASPKAAAVRTHTINSDDERDADDDEDHFEEDSLQTARAVAHAAADAADVHFDAYAAPLRPAADAPASDA